MNHRAIEAFCATLVLLMLILTNYFSPGIWYSLAAGWFFLTVLHFYSQWVFGSEKPTECDGLRDCLAKLRQEFHESVSRGYATLKIDLAKTKYLIAAVVLVVQPAALFLEFTFLPMIGCPETPPSFLDLENNLIGALSLVLIVGPLAEEYFFRRIFQERLSWILSENRSIVVASVAFVLYHLLPGNPLCDMYGLLFRFIRSLFYGLVYSRTRSFIASWVPHLGVNSLAIVGWLLFPVN